MSNQKPTPSLTGLIAAIPGRVFKRDALLVMVCLALGAGGVVWAQAHVKTELSEVAAAKVAPVKAQVDQLAIALEDLRRQLAAKESRDAERWDATYRLLVFGVRTPRQAELAQPTPDARDGGP